MDELIEEFLVETKEGLEALDNDLVSLEQNPEDKEIIGKIFRIMHTIKGTCGFLGMSRLEKVAHAGEDIFDKIRDGAIKVTPEIISMVFQALDKIKEIVAYLEENEKEPVGDDSDLVTKLRACAKGEMPAPAKVVEVVKPVEPVAPVITVQEKTLQGIPQDSEDLQALFDKTESLINVSQPTAAKSAANDSEDLQALFDKTESLVDVSQVNKPAVVEESKKEDDHAAHKKEEAAHKNDNKAKKDAGNQTIRVNLDVLDQLMQHVSELVLTRNQLMQILRTNRETSFNTALQRLNSITTELQEGVMKTRMQPVGNAWTKLPRIVRDLSMELNKKIDLVMSGEDTELDRQLLERITDPLTHMVRNSADHGLEGPKDRLAAGKPEVGTINLRAYHGGGYIIIEISDDGRGIDPAKIKQKAIEKGLVSETIASQMSDSQILQFIFAAGFSTAEKVTSVSGRGVGMDVVKNNIESISGTVDLKSEVGKGAVFTIKIPLTLAIMPILQVTVKEQKFAIPQINVIEVVKSSRKSGFVIETINSKPVLRLRGSLLPLVSLAETLKIGTTEYGDESIPKYIVVCELGSYHFGVIVEQVSDTEEIVVKPVAKILKGVDFYSGSTILGDGSVILILDPNGLARATGEITGLDKAAARNKKSSEDADKSSFIVFKAGDVTPKVVPLELISRLEEIDVSKIEYSHGMPVIQYRDDLMKIVQIDENYKLPANGMQELLVLSNRGKIMGLVVEEILDIAKCSVDHDLSSGRDGFIGSMVIDGKTCDVIDVTYYFDKAFPDLQDEEKPKTNEVKKKILLADDSAFFRKFIPPELKDQGYDVEVCSSGSKAVEILNKAHDFFAIITDIHMPGMGGVELAQICKGDPKLKDIPVIAMSSHSEDKAGKQISDLKEFYAFVSKTDHKDILTVLSDIKVREKAA